MSPNRRVTWKVVITASDMIFVPSKRITAITRASSLGHSRGGPRSTTERIVSCSFHRIAFDLSAILQCHRTARRGHAYDETNVVSPQRSSLPRRPPFGHWNSRERNVQFAANLPYLGREFAEQVLRCETREEPDRIGF